MSNTEELGFTAFAGQTHIATGSLLAVAKAAKERIDSGEQQLIALFDNATGRVVDLDFRGSMDEFAARLTELTKADPQAARAPESEPAKRGPGRPRLGVVSREVTLLPRHWEWLNAQPNGASAALRRLVENAMREGRLAERARRLQEAAYHFMSYIAGDAPHFEEASRALFAHDYGRVAELTAQWPADVREHLLWLLQHVKQAEAAAQADQNDQIDNE